MNNKAQALVHLIMTLIIVTGASYISVKVWSEKKEEISHIDSLVISAAMSLTEVQVKNSLPQEVIKDVFKIQNKEQLQDTVSKYTNNIELTKKKLLETLALYEEHTSKNWFKIPLKFILWFTFMGIVFVLLRKKKINSSNRSFLYLLSFIIFGIIFGADPAPMGTVKDAVALFGEKHVIFKPRMVAMAIFLLTVFLANKMICSWGCQFGTLQDYIFRINKNVTGFKQTKIPFIISNSVRIFFFIAFTAIAFIIPYDIISEIDPFKIYKPQYLSVIGAIFIVSLVTASLFVYRPWCHLFCPFGLVSWVIEQFSWNKIRVNADKCINCNACSKNCPSTSMEVILKGDKLRPDCFSCGSCIESCSNNALSYSTKLKENKK